MRGIKGLANFLLQVSFVITKSDASLFTYTQGDHMVYLLLYVDDIVLCTSSNALSDSLIAHLTTGFSISDLESFNYF